MHLLTDNQPILKSKKSKIKTKIKIQKIKNQKTKNKNQLNQRIRSAVWFVCRCVLVALCCLVFSRLIVSGLLVSWRVSIFLSCLKGTKDYNTNNTKKDEDKERIDSWFRYVFNLLSLLASVILSQSWVTTEIWLHCLMWLLLPRPVQFSHR
jgi:hypothetical protein